MRRHASSIVIKIMMGAIIITFIFFFGYSTFRKGTRGGRMGGGDTQAVAKVGSTPISDAEYRFFVDRKVEQFRASFKDAEMPEFARKLAESSAFQEIIGREVALKLADDLGLVITDVELADVIRKAQTGEARGDFDPVEYRHRFLPYFRNRFNLDYEQFVRQDLRLEALRSLFGGVDAGMPFGSEDADGVATTWTFESVMIDPKSLAQSKAVASEEDARERAKKLAAARPSQWKRLLGPLKLKPIKVGPIGISERHQLLDGKGTQDDLVSLFSLTKEHPSAGAPIEKDGRLYVVRLSDKAKKADAKPRAIDDFFQSWTSKLTAQAKVQNYLEKR